MPFADYGGFGRDYFEGLLYMMLASGYSRYERDLLPFDHYAELLRTKLVERGIDPAGEKVLVVGCAYGYTVEYLRSDWGIDAYGMDVSQWAVDNAVVDGIYQGDATSANDLRSVRQDTPGGRFGVVFSEAMLSTMTDAEAVAACDNMRSEAQQAAVHRVWSSDGSDIVPEYYNSKTLSEWRALCDPDGDDYWFTEREFQP